MFYLIGAGIFVIWLVFVKYWVLFLDKHGFPLLNENRTKVNWMNVRLCVHPPLLVAILVSSLDSSGMQAYIVTVVANLICTEVLFLWLIPGVFKLFNIPHVRMLIDDDN